MKYLLPCSLCITTNTLCTPECLYAPFFPTHMVNLAEKVNNVFSHHYILTSLENFNLQQLPQSVSNLFIKNLFKEAAFRLANPVLGNHGRCKVLSINVKILQTKVAAQRAELQQIRFALYGIQQMLDGEPQHSSQQSSSG